MAFRQKIFDRHRCWSSANKGKHCSLSFFLDVYVCVTWHQWHDRRSTIVVMFLFSIPSVSSNDCYGRLLPCRNVLYFQYYSLSTVYALKLLLISSRGAALHRIPFRGHGECLNTIQFSQFKLVWSLLYIVIQIQYEEREKKILTWKDSVMSVKK